MNILISIILMTMSIFESSSLEELKGKWTAGVRLDNIYSAYRHFYTGIYTSEYEDGASAYLSTESRESWGFPSEYCILWRPKEDIAIGIESKVYYYYIPSSKYENFYYREGTLYQTEKGEYKYENWSGSIGPEIYKYFCTNKSFSPYITVSPNFVISHSEHVDERSTIDAQEDTVLYHRSSTENRKSYGYGIDVNCGVEYFFTLSDIHLSIRAKTSLADISREHIEYESTRITERDDREENKYGRKEAPFRLNFYIPTRGHMSIWLCCHF